MIQIVMVGMWTESKHTSQRTLALTHCVFFPLQFEKKNHQITTAGEGQLKGRKCEHTKHVRDRQEVRFRLENVEKTLEPIPSGQIIDITHQCPRWICFNIVLSLCLSHEHRDREATGGNVKWLWLWAQAQTDTGTLHIPQVHCSTS